MRAEHRVLITTSGTGSRLGKLTKSTNKSLVKINGRPAIDYIINKYSPDIPIVVTIGYYGIEVKNYLLKRFKNRRFHFEEVDKYEGEGSSLGYSMLQAKRSLQCPFIFHCCDTIVDDQLAEPSENWVMGYNSVDHNQYRTLNTKDKSVISINDKGVGNSNYVHIGLIGIKDYAEFWSSLNALYHDNPNDNSLNDTYVINRMLEHGIDFKFIESKTWYDTGNPTALEKTIKLLRPKNV